MLPAAHPASLNDVIRASDLSALSGFVVTKEKSCVIDYERCGMHKCRIKCVAFTISAETPNARQTTHRVAGSGNFAGYIEPIGNRRLLTVLIVGIFHERRKRIQWRTERSTCARCSLEIYVKRYSKHSFLFVMCYDLGSSQYN